MKPERIMALRAQQKRETERHRNTMAKLAADRALALTVEDSMKRSAKLSKIMASQTDEMSRHRDKAADLNRKLRAAWA